MSNGGYYTGTPTYVAVQQMPRTRYVAVRNYDYDNYVPQYVAVRRQPAYVDMNSKYALMRNNYVRTRYVAVRDRDMGNYDYAPTQYVAVRHAPETRFVTVRNMDSSYDYGMSSVGYIPVRYSAQDTRPIGYVPIRNSGCGCATSDLQGYETMSPRHVVVKSDYLDETQDVIYPDVSYEDTAYVSMPENTNVVYNVGHFHNNGTRVIPVSYVDSGNVSYVPASYDNDNDFDDQAILDTSDVTYVAAGGVRDACLSPVSYVTTDGIKAYDSGTYVPVSNVAYMRAEPVSYVPIENVSYVPAKRTHTRSVSYVPAESVDYVDTADTRVCECPVSENRNVGNIYRTDQVADTSAEVEDNVSDVTAYTVANSTMTDAQAASENGYRDGFEDGKQAALNGNEYRPANSSDFQEADDGYDRSFGSKDAYGHTYRASYLKGYNAGFDAAVSSD